MGNYPPLKVLFAKNATMDVFGVMGDSNADGRGATIPTIASNTLFNWNGSSYDTITTQSVANDDNTKGSIWQNFAVEYKTATGRPAYLCNGASGGAEFYPNGDTNNWYDSGTLRASFITKMNGALAARGASRPTAIFVILGVNDLRSANTITDIRTGIDSFFNWVTGTYPDTPIILVQVGREETTISNGQKAYDIRNYLIQKCEQYTNVYMGASAAFFIGVTNGYNVDNLHYSQATNDVIGYQLNQWFVNSTITNKWARAVVSSHYDSLNATRKTLISDFITTQYTNGNYMKAEGIHNFCTANVNNLCMDWTFLGYGAPGSTLGFTANSHMTTTGVTSSFWAMSFTPSIYTRASSQNDILFGVKLRTRTTAAGTAAVLMGRSDGTYQCRIGQSTTFVNYHVNNTGANQRNTAETSLTAGVLYSAARNGTTRYLIKDATINDTNVQASDGLLTQNFIIGLNNSNSTLSFPINATQSYAYASKYTTFDLSSFHTGMEYLIAHWND